MNYRDFGKSGIKVSEVGFGAWAIGGSRHGISYGPVDDKDSIHAIERAIDLGCNYFDTADVYGWGHSEEILGNVLKSNRDKVIIATKVGSDFYQGYGFQTFTSDYIRFAFDKSLSRLKTDYIDVYQLHNPPLDLMGRQETYSVLDGLKKEGKIRAWGLSVTSSEEASAALDLARPDCLQIPINMFSTDKIMTEEVLSNAYEQGCALIAREPLANGFLSGKYDPNTTFPQGDIRHNWPRDYINARIHAADKLGFLKRAGSRTLAQSAILWVLRLKQVSLTIAGCKTVDRVEENFSSTDCPSLEKSELNKVETLRKNDFGI